MLARLKFVHPLLYPLLPFPWPRGSDISELIHILRAFRETISYNLPRRIRQDPHTTQPPPTRWQEAPLVPLFPLLTVTHYAGTNSPLLGPNSALNGMPAVRHSSSVTLSKPVSVFSPSTVSKTSSLTKPGTSLALAPC